MIGLAKAARPLIDRVTEAMTALASSEEVAKLLPELERTLAETIALRDEKHAVAVSARSDDDTADEAADAAMKATRKIVRLQGQISDVTARVEALRDEEAALARGRERSRVQSVRDKLVADLRKEWPGLAERMVALIARIEESDADCRRVGIEGAESIARGCPPNFYVPIGTSGSQLVTRLRAGNVWGLDASTAKAAATPLGERKTWDAR